MLRHSSHVCFSSQKKQKTIWLDSFIYLSIHSFIQSTINSCIHSFTNSLMNAFIHLLCIYANGEKGSPTKCFLLTHQLISLVYCPLVVKHAQLNDLIHPPLQTMTYRQLAPLMVHCVALSTNQEQPEPVYGRQKSVFLPCSCATT